MSRHAFVWLSLLTIIYAVPLPADGGFFGRGLDASTRPSSAAQKAVLIREGPDEVLLLQTTYQGPAARFAWVVPVPAQPTEVFLAEPIFIEQVFQRTNPEQQTDVEANWGFARPLHWRLGRDRAAPPPAGGPGLSATAPPPVTVLERMAVGDFDATLLAATDAAQLQQWLARNRYALPADAVPVLAEYVRQRWVFVALKMLDKAAQDKPMLADVPPLGLRFRAQKLVYPLAISRISAPPLSAIMLCVIGDGYFTSPSLPAAELPGAKLTLGEYRRQMSRPGDRPALLREALADQALPWADLSYRQQDWTRRTHTNLRRQAVSRFFCLLKPTEMQDLEFVRDGHAQPYHLLCYRKGEASRRAFARLHAHPLALLRGGKRMDELKLARPGLSHLPEGLGALVLGGLGAVLALGFVVLIVAVVAKQLRRVFMVTLLVLLCTVTLAGGYAGSIEDRIDRLLAMVEAAAAQFRSDTGLNPASVSDLAGRRPPAEGLDASGNRVAVRAGWQGPYLSYAPPGPLGQGFVVDPLHTRLVDCGGFASAVEVQPGPPPGVRDSFGMPSPPPPPRGEEAHWVPEPLWGELPGETMPLLAGLAAALRSDGWQLLPKGAERCLAPGMQQWLVNFETQQAIVDERLWQLTPRRALITINASEAPPALSYVVVCDAQGVRLATPRPVAGLLGPVMPVGDEYLTEIQDDPMSFRRGDSRLVRLNLRDGRQTDVIKGRLAGAALAADGRTLYVVNDGALQSMALDGSNRRTLRRELGWPALAWCDAGLLVGDCQYIRPGSRAKRSLGLLRPDGQWRRLVALPAALSPGALTGDVLTYETTAEDADGGSAPYLHTLRRRDLRTGREQVLLRARLPGYADLQVLSADAARVLVGLTMHEPHSGHAEAGLLSVTTDGTVTFQDTAAAGPPNLYQLRAPVPLPRADELTLASFWP